MPPLSSAPRSRREPSQERSRETVRRILAAAEELVAEGGVDAATTRAVAERAGVAVPSLYRFFADRDDVLDALVERMLAELEDATQAQEAAWAGDEIAELVGILLDVHVGYYREHPSLAALWFGGRASPAVVAAVRARNEVLGDRLRELLVARGLIAASAPRAAFHLLTELGDRVLQVAFRDPRAPDLQALELGRQALVAFAERWAVPR